MTQEKRKMKRFPLRLKTGLQVSNPAIIDEGRELLSKDISSAGVFLLTSESLPLNTRVNLGFSMPRGFGSETKSESYMINASGRVVRVTEEGIAVSFDKKCKIP